MRCRQDQCLLDDLAGFVFSGQQKVLFQDGDSDSNHIRSVVAAQILVNARQFMGVEYLPTFILNPSYIIL